MMNKITTKRGDSGLTDLLGKNRVEKTDLRVEANGEIDELMSLLGMLKAHPELPTNLYNRVENIQKALMMVMHHVASIATVSVDNLQTETVAMEQFIDEVCRGRNFNFVLPGSSPVEALLQMARAKTRTTERRLCAVNAKYKLSPVVMAYINRLSDYLFAMATIS